LPLSAVGDRYRPVAVSLSLSEIAIAPVAVLLSLSAVPVAPWGPATSGVIAEPEKRIKS